MNQLALIGVLLALFGLGAAIFLFLHFRNTLKKLQGETGDELLKLLNWLKQDIEATRKEIGEGLRFSTSEVQRTLESAHQAYSVLMKEMGGLQEIGRDMKNLQEFFRSPKYRGNIGEQILEDYLERVLPQQSFVKQYAFREGSIVDIIIKTNQGLIPIDAKFTLESFLRLSSANTEEEKELYRKEFAKAIKRHIDDIARKYILPQEGTVDFAIMYVPSEPVYYEIITNLPGLTEYGDQKKVYFISPKTLYYFLKTVLLTLQGARIEEAAKKILRGFHAVEQESLNLGEELGTLFGHVDRAKGSALRTQTRFEKMMGKIEHLTMLQEPEETPQLRSKRTTQIERKKG